MYCTCGSEFNPMINGCPDQAPNSNIVKKMLVAHMEKKIHQVTILHMSWQLSCHDVCKIVDQIFRIKLQANIIYIRFQFYAHKSFMKWSPAVMFVFVLNCSNMNPYGIISCCCWGRICSLYWILLNPFFCFHIWMYIDYTNHRKSLLIMSLCLKVKYRTKSTCRLQ